MVPNARESNFNLPPNQKKKWHCYHEWFEASMHDPNITLNPLIGSLPIECSPMNLILSYQP